MASFNPASGVWPEDYDESGNVVRRNRDARQVHHMNNMPGRLPPPPPAFSPRGTFAPETRCYPYFPGQLPPAPQASSTMGTFAPEAHHPPFPPGPDCTFSARPPAGFPRTFAPEAQHPPFPPGPDCTFPARPPAGFPPLIHKHHEAGAQVARNEMAAFHDSPSDLWTPGYDQFGNSCWQNKLTLELHYDTPPRQPPAHPSQAFAGHPRYPHLPIDHPFEHDPRPPPERFPPRRELDKHVRFQPPALNVLEPAKGCTVPTGKDARPLPTFPPNNFARSPPPSWPRAPASPKKSKNEADQWFLQSNGKDKDYYLNTSTWEWQYETPDCLKKKKTCR